MDKVSQVIRVLIADDHPILRDSLRYLLSANAGFEVVGEAADADQTIKLAKQLKPDILLLDLAMPGRNGMDALRELYAISSPVRTFLLTAAIEPVEVVEALQLGARGILLKDTAPPLLFKSILSVMEGQYWLGHESVSNLVEGLRQLLPQEGPAAQKKTFGLTPRELEIVSMIVAGYTNADLARRFAIKEHTVKSHLTNIFDKVGVSTRVELALFALKHDLVNDV